MSTSSNNRRSGPVYNSDDVFRNGVPPRQDSRRNPIHSPVTTHDAYIYALRVAYLAHLLRPRPRRNQRAPTRPPQTARASASINDLLKDFSLRDSKSTRFPHGFMLELEKRLTGVMMGREKRQEFHDPAIKRSFAAALNAFLETGFKKRMEKDRRIEDLVLIFFSNATRVLQAGKAPSDDTWKLMVDRHVALFVRLVSLILTEQDWARDRPELVSRLATLESKLLSHDQDLSSLGNGDGPALSIEIATPPSKNVQDMALVRVVGRVFGLADSRLQSDIDQNAATWTEKAALRDLKTYQSLLSLNSRNTLRSSDFDLEEAYESWKKAEAPEISQMVYSIVQVDPELAKSTPVATRPPLSTSIALSTTTGPSRSHSEAPNGKSNLSTPPRPVLGLRTGTTWNVNGTDEATLTKSPESAIPGGPVISDDHPFTFIPPNPRNHYRALVSHALSQELRDESSQPPEAASDSSMLALLSKPVNELLNEVASWWRLPLVSRLILFLDTCRQKFHDGEISLETLNAAFEAVHAPTLDNTNATDSEAAKDILRRRGFWPLADFSLNQRLLVALHESLLRDLYSTVLSCFEPKPPSVGLIMHVLTTHVEEDPSFPREAADSTTFTSELRQGLQERARATYRELMEKHMSPDLQDTWEFYHVIELSRAIVALAERLRKRYRKNPEVMGANPLTIFVENVLPHFAEDARDVVGHILQLAKIRGQDVPIEDGFQLYQELAEIRNIHSQALPSVDFTFHLEELLADFVWRWIRLTEESMGGWIEGAIRHDEFKVRSQPGEIPSEDERHSVSVIDAFSSFNQAIEKVVALNWDNDLHYAKFMTALSKIIGAGIARYCDVVEQKFRREMDRLTPEQEAIANQTRQERWMQLAKDAWNNKDRIEPFQFYSESFVKLNDIEFATRHLDRLEKEINVDACVDVIERHQPPPLMRPKRTTNYVFTIKIVEAEDLRACDLIGLSDPYVVLGDEYQKRLAKTRIIHGNLNPRWDESVDITTQTPLNIIATVWDWDQLGDHDCVGRTSIKLDPAHFSDFLPREYWLDLDTQGRLLLRVSMEGERDDIQFYFGKAFRTLKRTEREMTRTITDKLSAYIQHCLSRRALRTLTGKGISMATVSNYFNRTKPPQTNAGPTDLEISEALKPLFTYFDDNFAIMNQTLTTAAMIMVMSRLWKEVLTTVESLVVPPLSDKPSQQKPLNQKELDIVFRWLDLLYDFFHAVDEDTGEANGVPMDVLRSPKYFEIKTLNFFYFETTESLIRESERMASASAARQQSNRNRLSAPPATGGRLNGSSLFAGSSGLGSRQKAKSIMLSRNLGTMRKAKEEKRKEAQAEPNDDIILRILRMRPEAHRYLKDRSRQKERLAAAAAAELIVRQSILAGGGRMVANLPRR